MLRVGSPTAKNMPMSASQAKSLPKTVALAGVAATRAFGQKCAAAARPGDVFFLSGTLGAGKTTFARAFVNAIAERNGAPAEEVPSPTFTLVQIYEFAGHTVYHFDLYRIDDVDDTAELGLDDAFADGISLIEWPERLGPLVPPDRVDLAFGFGDGPDDRTCVVRGHGAGEARAMDILRDG